MGTDMSGFVECRAWHLHEEGEESVWRAAIDLIFLNVNRDYDAFGCLFGVRNYANFRPLAADRGLPVDASETVRAELDRLAPWQDQAYGTTWITWAELKAVDWNEPAERADSRLHQYRRTADGWILTGKRTWSPQVAQAIGLPEQEPGQAQEWPEGSEWLVGDTLYKSETIRRRDAVLEPGDWKPVWTVMEALALLHGDDSVRLVVWFGN
ncbi:hypothetical protein [Streptomyces sp. H39-S7]|uniref:hypothetical protein n=1 Tax=Streptomyces sp. H39-S7 TaxID=3004357 RepID=UPI0022AF3F2A|nr:hypothetical protein [Streptomyces sp. H39-S7]MCZ4119826.1 hypothetical protein [Streptomyces sp. H39-S7]